MTKKPKKPTKARPSKIERAKARCEKAINDTLVAHGFGLVPIPYIQPDGRIVATFELVVVPPAPKNEKRHA